MALRLGRRLRRFVEDLTAFQITRLGREHFPLREPRPTDITGIAILADPAFRAALGHCLDHTVLDTARLANLWQLSRLSDPRGAIAEIGSYRGGGALLLGLANPDRQLFVCDTFRGFGAQHIDPRRDARFHRGHFLDTSREAVDGLLGRHLARYSIVEGEFPSSDPDGVVADLSFVHLDVDLHEATLACLREILPRCRPRAIIVVDDYRRSCDGVDEAVAEALERQPGWAAFPLYPGQAMLVSGGWLSA